MNIGIIIAAAGSSSRYGSGDKLVQDLGGRPVLIRTVEAFTKRSEVRAIVVVGPPDEMDQFRDRFAATLGFHGATVVPGGRVERWESIRNGLAALPDDLTHIAVHDGARPGVPDDLLSRVFDAAASLDAVIPVLDVDATVKRVAREETAVDEGEDDALADAILGAETRTTIPTRRVIETIDRTGVVTVQTPQVFAAELLRRAYDQPDLSGATDDASLVERLGETVHVVEGDRRNFKITVPADLELMRNAFGFRAPAERPVHKRF